MAKRMALDTRLMCQRVTVVRAALTRGQARLDVVAGVGMLALRRLLPHHNLIHNLSPHMHMLLCMMWWCLRQLVLLQRRLHFIAALVAGCVAQPSTSGGARRYAAPSAWSIFLLLLLLLPLWQSQHCVRIALVSNVLS